MKSFSNLKIKISCGREDLFDLHFAFAVIMCQRKKSLYIHDIVHNIIWTIVSVVISYITEESFVYSSPATSEELTDTSLGFLIY